jgi:hypothetical protein
MSPSGPSIRPALLGGLVLILLGLVSLGALPLLGALLAAAAAALSVARPAAAACAAVFVLYTNIPVVAAQRGLVPVQAAALVPLLLAPAFSREVVLRRRPIHQDRTLWVMIAFLGALVLSAFGAPGPGVALGRIGVYVAEGLLIYFLVTNAVRDLKTLRVVIWGVLAATTFLATLTIWQQVTGNYEQDFIGLASRDLRNIEGVPLWELAEAGDDDRARGPVDDPNRYAQILLMAAPLALTFAMSARRLGARLVASSVFVLLLAVVLLTYSRGAFLTLVVLVLLAPALGLVKPSRLAAVLLIGALLTPVVAPGYAGRVGSIGGVAGLFGAANVEADAVTRGRSTEMLAALSAYLDHPFLGVGPGQYLEFYAVHYQAQPGVSLRELTRPRRAHNLYLEVAAELGTVGLALFMAIPLLLLMDLERLRRGLQQRRPDLARLAAAFVLALLSYLGTGVFLHMAFERYYWLMVALAASTVAVLEQPGATTEPRHTVVEGESCFAS